MLLLTFRSGESLYAVDALQVVEVVPRVECRRIPHAPDFFLGMLSYRGGVVPVVDFARLVGSSSSRDALSTRIIVTRFTVPGSPPRQLGLVSESVDQVLRARPDQQVLGGMGLREAPYLGSMYQLDEGMVQVVRPERVLDDRMQAALFVDSPAVRS